MRIFDHQAPAARGVPAKDQSHARSVVGLIPLALGIVGFVWIMRAAFVQTPDTVELRQAAFLLTSGPYAHSRNPMYISELALWLGWAMFYGSVPVLIGFAILLPVLVLAALHEERGAPRAVRRNVSGVPAHRAAMARTRRQV